MARKNKSKFRKAERNINTASVDSEQSGSPISPEISEAVSKSMKLLTDLKTENGALFYTDIHQELVKMLKLGIQKGYQKGYNEGRILGRHLGRDEVLEAYENAVKNIKARTSHPLSDMLPEMKKQGLKVGILDGGWINWFDLQNELETIKSKFGGGKG